MQLRFPVSDVRPAWIDGSAGARPAHSNLPALHNSRSRPPFVSTLHLFSFPPLKSVILSSAVSIGLSGLAVLSRGRTHVPRNVLVRPRDRSPVSFQRPVRVLCSTISVDVLSGSDVAPGICRNSSASLRATVRTDLITGTNVAFTFPVAPLSGLGK